MLFFHFASGGIESFKSFPEDDVSWRSCEGSGFHKEKPQDWRLGSREIWVSGSLKPRHLCSLESDAGLLRCPSPLHVSWEGGFLKLPPHPSDPGWLLLALLLGGRKISEAVETICFSHYLPNLLPQTISQRSWAHVGLQPYHLPTEPPALGQRRFANEHAASIPLSLEHVTVSHLETAP